MLLSKCFDLFQKSIIQKDAHSFEREEILFLKDGMIRFHYCFVWTDRE